MYAKGKPTHVPSDAQSREKLAVYVYEYLIHVGASQTAEMFLKELQWEKKISLGEPPGFLQSWWSVFWDLYCAAPERRDSCEHSNEAKAFHDYGFVNSGYGVNGMGHNSGPAPSPINQMPPNEGMPGGPMPPAFFNNNSNMRPSPPTHPSNQQSPQHPQGPPPPHSQMMSNQFMGPRFGGGPRPPVRMPQMGGDFNGPPGQPMMSNSMDQIRQGEAGEFIGWQGPPGMNPMNPRMNPPRGPGMGPMGPSGYNPNMRGPPPNSMGGGPNGPGGPGGMPPMSMSNPRPQWQPNVSTPMSYSSPSPGNYGGPPGSAGPPGPGTPIMQSPQDSSNSGNDNMYTMMKSVQGQNMQGDYGGPMGGGPDGGPMGQMGSVLNGDGMDGMKNSPANGGPGTPREDNDYNLGGFGGPNENDSLAAIAKIKERIMEDTRRFEKDSAFEFNN